MVAAFGINLVHVYFFKNQRLARIDRQILESSGELVSSPAFLSAVSTPGTVEETISKVLKGGRIGKVFLVRDSSAKIVYQSFNASLLNAEMPISPEWVTIETESEYIRLRNLVLPGKKPLVLQVGLVLDRNFLYWEVIDNRVVNYIAGIVLALFLFSVILTLILLAPLRSLIAHLNSATSSLTNLKDVQPLPNKLKLYADGFWAKSDEFSGLLNTVQKLIDRINMNYKLTRSWTLQMAHELKTPLAIIQAETDAKLKAKLLPEEYGRDVIKEVEQMSETIGQFLDWAELENSLVKRDLYALRMKAVLKGVTARLDKISNGRIQLNLENDFSVFATPIHLDQLIGNLVTNALKYSPVDRNVEVSLTDHKIVVRDYGMGLPQLVKERLGQPFNIGTYNGMASTGNGLGLAWVLTVCKLYQWNLAIISESSGTEVSIRFPNEEAKIM